MSQEAAKTDHAGNLFQRVESIIDRIRPAVQSDGGDLELVGVTEEGVVQIRLHGECVGCPSSSMTLHMGIERNLRERVPEVTGVEQVS
jgi:Fe-S cluster biogenesis protein NfuA